MQPTPYLAPIQLRGRVNRPQPRGLPIINVGFNELPYPPIPAVAAALRGATAKAQSYGSPHCDALRDRLGRLHGLNPDHLICGNGSEELLDVIARCFARPGDAVLISAYGYIQFMLATNRVGASLVKVPEKDFTTDMDALVNAVTDKTRVLFLANPNNPTGTMVPVAELARLAQGVPEHVVLVFDLAYGEFAAPDYCAKVHALVSDHQNLIVTRTFSKAYGLAGLRVGWAHANPWMIPVLYAARGMGTVNAVAQAGALAALEEHAEVSARVAEITSERTRIADVLGQLGLEVMPSHTNFFMARFRDGSAALTEALVEDLFDRGGFIVNRTREAGLEEFFRFSIHLPENNDRLIDCIRAFVSERR